MNIGELLSSEHMLVILSPAKGSALWDVLNFP